MYRLNLSVIVRQPLNTTFHQFHSHYVKRTLLSFGCTVLGSARFAVFAQAFILLDANKFIFFYIICF